MNPRTLIDGYYEWLKDKTAWKQLKEDWVEITTPYLDRQDDYIQIYLKQDGNDYILSDDSCTIKNLDPFASFFYSPTNQTLLEQTLNDYGVQRNGWELFIKAGQQDFSLKMHNLIQTINSISSWLIPLSGRKFND